MYGVRLNYKSLFGTFSTPGQTNVSTKSKAEILAAITAQINATGSGQLRSVEQEQLLWKNLKQKTTKDQAEAKKNLNWEQALQRWDLTAWF